MIESIKRKTLDKIVSAFATATATFVGRSGCTRLRLVQPKRASTTCVMKLIIHTIHTIDSQYLPGMYTAYHTTYI